MHEYADKEI